MSIEKKCKVIIPVFFPGKIILKCISSIPKKFQIIILDNANNDNYLLKIIKKIKRNIKIYNVGDVGVAKSFNFAIENIKSKFFFITQPDVVLKKNCIEKLYKVSNKNSNIAISSPLVFEKNVYSNFDHYNLKILNNNRLAKKQIKKHKDILIPKIDFFVEAINSTALLVNTSIVKKIGSWDENFYTYLEDIDISLRIRQNGYFIKKIINARVDHLGFSSNQGVNKESIEKSRNWHFAWSSIYFVKKHYDIYYFFFIFFQKMFKYFLKTLINVVLLKRKKAVLNFLRLHACFSFILNKSFIYKIKN